MISFVYIIIGDPVKIADLARLTKLKTLYLNNFIEERCRGFVNDLFANLPALGTCVIIGRRLTKDRAFELLGLAQHLDKIKFIDYYNSNFYYKESAKSRAPSDGSSASKENAGASVFVPVFSLK